jgi:biotin carboxylase
MSKKIVILGTSEHINPAIERAKSLGFETYVFAWHADEIGEKTADCYYPISLRNYEEICEQCRKIEPLGIVSLSSDLAAITASYISDKLSLVGNGYQQTLQITNKLQCRRILEKSGIPQPRFVGIGDEMSVGDCKKIEFPVIVKPTDRSGSRGVKKIRNRSELLRGLATARDISFERRAIVEDYIIGRHFSCECISYHGEHRILAYTKRDDIEGQSCFIEHLHSQPANLTEEQRQRADYVVQCALNTLQIKNGASSVEFVIDLDNQLKVIEVTPSMYGDFIGTDLVPVSTGFDYVKMILNIACGVAPDFTRSANTATVCSQIIVCKQDVLKLNHLLKSNPESLLRHKLMVNEAEVPDEITGERYGFFIYKH